MDTLVLWQKIEGGLIFMSGLALFAHLDPGWGWGMAALLFFAPDLSFSAYLAGPKVGAFFYNLLHVYALGAALLAAGLILSCPIPAALGALWLAHSGFDRMLGYGLKSPAGFSFTHLGRIGKQGGR